MEEVVIKVGGMSCQGCVKNVTGVLSELAGVDRVEVSLERGTAHVFFDASRVQAEALKSTIEDAGFDAELP
ncbi:MAG: heavy-metal-associated domain-containing protein [Betaproteobacteria bacterium]